MAIFTDENAFIDTRDEDGAHRYHSMNIAAHSDPKPEFGLYMRKVIPESLKFMEEEYGFPYVERQDYISKESVVFHHHSSAAELKRMEMLLYKDIDQECGRS